MGSWFRFLGHHARDGRNSIAQAPRRKLPILSPGGSEAVLFLLFFFPLHLGLVQMFNL